MLELRLEVGKDDEVEAAARRLCEQVVRAQTIADVTLIGKDFDLLERSLYMLASAAATYGLRIETNLLPRAGDAGLVYRLSLF